MSQPDDQSSFHNDLDGNGNGEIGRVIDEFLLALENGEAVDANELLDRYPQWTGVLGPAVAQLVSLYRVSRNLDAPEALGPVDLSRGEFKLGDFRIIREVGRGGMGIVYEAEQVSVGRRVALKVLPFAAVLDEKQLTRFKNEVRAAGALQHPNIVPVYAVGCERGTHYFSMRFIDGHTLAEAITALRASNRMQTIADSVPTDVLATVAALNKRHNDSAFSETCSTSPAGRELLSVASSMDATGSREDRFAWLTTMLTEQRDNPQAHFAGIARLGIQAAEALQHAHEQGIVHRDIKPANLMVDSVGNLWVTDFGLARVESEVSVTMTGDVVGTLRYMSPEQATANADGIDHRTDIYSLGLTLYELTALQPAFSASDRGALLHALMNGESSPQHQLCASIPRTLVAIVSKAAARRPDDRYPTAGALACDLRAFVEGRPTVARPRGAIARTAQWLRRRSAVVVTIAVLIALTVSSFLTGRTPWSTPADVAKVDNPKTEDAKVAERVVATADQSGTPPKRPDASSQSPYREQYPFDMGVLWRAFQSNSYSSGRGILDRHVPAPNAQDYRGWEWHFLDSQLRKCPKVWREPGQSRSNISFLQNRHRLALSRPSDPDILDASAGRLYVLSPLEKFTDFAISPDRTHLAAGHTEGALHVWSFPPEFGKHTVCRSAHREAIQCISFAESRELLASSDISGIVCLWDTKSWEVIQQIRSLGKTIGPICLSPYGTLLAVATSTGDILVWDIQNDRQLQILPTASNDPIIVLRSTGNGDRIIALRRDGGCQSWEWSSDGLRRLAAWKMPTGENSCMAISRDGLHAYVGTEGGHVFVYRIEPSCPPELAKSFIASSDRIKALDVSFDGTTLATLDKYDYIRFWAADDLPGPILARDVPSEIDAVAVTPDGRRILVADHNSAVVHVYDVKTGIRTGTLYCYEPAATLTALACSHDSRLVAAAGNDGVVRVWDLDAQSILRSSIADKPVSSINAVAFFRDGKRFVTGGGTVRLWSTKSDQPIAELRTELPTRTVAIAVSSDGSRVFAADSVGCIRVWDASNHGLLNCWHAYGEKTALRGLIALDDGNVASVDHGAICVWNSPTGALIDSVSGLNLYQDDWRLHSRPAMSSGRAIGFPSTQGLEFRDVSTRALRFTLPVHRDVGGKSPMLMAISHNDRTLALVYRANDERGPQCRLEIFSGEN
jgi:WD40 repeat protein/serine/threonine protein kinase